MTRTTVGQVLVNDVLPPAMHRHDRVLDKRGIVDLFRELADTNPEEYRVAAQKLMTLGHYNAQAEGTSLRLEDLMPPPSVEVKMNTLRDRVRAISESNLPDDRKSQQIEQTVLQANPEIERELMDAGVAGGNSLALQIKSGSRGNASQLKQIAAGDMLVQDHRKRTIPMPILRGYAHGLDPAEYFAGSYGARQGTASTKFATRDAGFLGKQLAMIAHRLTVTEPDCGAKAGLPVEGGDPDNAGAVLASEAGRYAAGTVITPRIAKDLAGKQILVRSPITCQSAHGVCGRCAGQREKGRFPDVGDNVGMSAAQAVSEPLSQGMLSAKHSGGTVSGDQSKRHEQSGFEYVNQIVQAPKSFRGAATVAQTAGRVANLREAPQGGWYVDVDNKPHYLSPESPPLVKSGDKVEAGDALSEGTPNPAEIVRHKGVGEGRRSFVHAFYRALANSGVRANRRNVELIARGLINHVKVTDPDGIGPALPDDVVPYDVMARDYQPRPEAKDLAPHRAVDHYLEAPALHYSIGTQVTPRIADELHGFGVKSVTVHPSEPPFHPHMVRGMEIGLHDPSWQTRLASSYLQKGTLKAVHRGQAAPMHDTSYVAPLAEGKEFGKDLKTTGMY